MYVNVVSLKKVMIFFFAGDPQNDINSTSDPFKTLFVGRIVSILFFSFSFLINKHKLKHMNNPLLYEVVQYD